MKLYVLTNDLRIWNKSVYIFRVSRSISTDRWVPLQGYIALVLFNALSNAPIDSLMPSLCQAQQFIGHSRPRDGLL